MKIELKKECYGCGTKLDISKKDLFKEKKNDVWDTFTEMKKGKLYKKRLFRKDLYYIRERKIYKNAEVERTYVVCPICEKKISISKRSVKELKTTKGKWENKKDYNGKLSTMKGGK